MPSLLQHIPLFASLPESELQHLEACLRPLDLAASTVLFREDERGEAFYLILNGEIEIVKAAGTADERLLGVRGPGDYLGEMSLLNPDGLRTATVRTRTPSTLLLLTREDFNDLLARRPVLAYDMVRRLSLRLRDSQDEAIRDLSEKNRELQQAYDDLKAAQVQILLKDRLENELRMARQVQASFMPRHTPQLEGWQFAALWQPAREVSGDFYDFFPVLNNQLGLVMADVTDKGTPAALFMALSRSTLRASLMRAPSLLEGLTQANQLISADSPDSMFVTLCAAFLNPTTGELTYINAGHNPPLLYRAQTDTIEWLGRTGIPLGLDGGAGYSARTLTLAPGDLLVLYTDGLPDAINAAEEPYEMERVEQLVTAHHADPAVEVLKAFEESFTQFVGGTTPYDDITMLIVKRE